jgi:hypothetical protein
MNVNFAEGWSGRWRIEPIANSLSHVESVGLTLLEDLIWAGKRGILRPSCAQISPIAQRNSGILTSPLPVVRQEVNVGASANRERLGPISAKRVWAVRTLTPGICVRSTPSQPAGVGVCAPAALAIVVGNSFRPTHRS